MNRRRVIFYAIFDVVAALLVWLLFYFYRRITNDMVLFGDKIEYIDNIDECIKDKDLVLIMTEWDEIKGYDLSNYSNLMHNAVVYDGRNCYDLDEVRKHKMRYVSIGRMEVNNLE